MESNLDLENPALEPNSVVLRFNEHSPVVSRRQRGIKHPEQLSSYIYSHYSLFDHLLIH